MACFTLNGFQRNILAAFIQIAMDGAPDMTEADEETFAAMIEELEASNNAMEITLAAIEEDDLDPISAMNLHEPHASDARDALLKAGAS